MASAAHYEGFLTKKSIKDTKKQNWKQRYLVLDGVHLHYFKNDAEACCFVFCPCCVL
jgi:hypothetical protein